MMAGTKLAPVQFASPTQTAAENPYAHLFVDYIQRSLTESLAMVRTVETKLSDEARLQACHVLDYGLQRAASWASSRALTIALASYMERSGQWESWEQLLLRAITVAQQARDTNDEVTLTALLARLYQRWSKTTQMVQTYRQVIRLARRSGNRYELARACSNLGFFYVFSKNLWRAELLNRYALAIFSDLKSDHGQAHTHNHLGILFTQHHEWGKAQEHLLAACSIWQANEDHFGLMRGYGNLGFLYNETANYAEGIKHSARALELAEMLGEDPLIGSFAANLSLGFLKIGNVQKAQDFAKLAEKVFDKYSDRLGFAQISHTKALIAMHEKDYLKARQSISDSLSELREHYFLIQVKFTKLELEIQLYNYAVAQQELEELYTLITKYLRGNALKLYLDQFIKSRHRLAQAIICTQVPNNADNIN